MRVRIVLMLLLFAAPAALLLLFAAPAAADRPEYVLSLSTSKKRVELGDQMVLLVKLTKKRGKPVKINDLRLARNSISFRVTYGERGHTVTRIYGRSERGADDQYRMVDETPPRRTLRRGKGLTLEVPLLAIRTGEMKVRAIYTGFFAGAPQLESEELMIPVTAREGKERVGAAMKTSAGEMEFELYPEKAFNTVQNFLTLAQDKLYDGLTFHRIMKGFMIQGGAPKGDGGGGPGWYIPGEFDPALKHEKGVISMARTPAPDSAGCQFFIMHGTSSGLDKNYAIFGRLVSGEEVLDKLAEARVVSKPSGEKSKPVEPPIIKSVRLVLR